MERLQPKPQRRAKLLTNSAALRMWTKEASDSGVADKTQRFHLSWFQSFQELDFHEEELSDHRRESQLEDQRLDVLSQEGDEVLAPIG